MNQYPLGNLVRLIGEFRVSGTYFDPTLVYVALQKDGSKLTFAYGTDVEVLRLSDGVYALDVIADRVGLYTYLWFSSGTGQSASQKNFEVTDTIGN